MSYRMACGCIPDASGYGYCDKCVSSLRAKIWKEMPFDKKEYDRQFDPVGSSALDAHEMGPPTACSCHINPPCSYCTSQSDDDESG